MPGLGGEICGVWSPSGVGGVGGDLGEYQTAVEFQVGPSF
jgi:hypothetical protein